MGIFRKRENRAELNTVQFDDALLSALLGRSTVTKETAMQVPTVSGGIDLIANIVAGTPIKLYREGAGRTEEIKDDPRLRLLNDETGDTLNASEFWKAIVRDYYVGKGGYAYIRKEKGGFKSLHYVDEAEISIQKNTDPIFKDFDIFVQGQKFKSFDFLKILRNTKDGASGIPITIENSKLIEVAYRSLILENNMVRRGGRKKGFLESEKRLEKDALDALRSAFRNLYGGNDENDAENFIVLNNGVKFSEATNTAVEMQVNENKLANAEEFAKIFHISTGAMSGKATDGDISSLAKLAAIPLMTTIQCALNKDFLLEKEKGKLYWAFDTKELLKGDMKERFEAYRTALESNFMQIDEVRYAEDMEPLGLSWIRLGLQDVLYDPKTKTLYTPNTNKTSVMGEETLDESTEATDEDNALPPDSRNAIIEPRANPNHDPKNGRFASKGGGGSAGKNGSGKTKYAPSPQRNKGGIQLKPKTYAKLCGEFKTRYPDLKPEDGPVELNKGSYRYKASADGFGGLIVHKKAKIK